MADLLARILADTGLTSRRRQDIASAVRTIGKALGRPLADLPAHPAYLRSRLAGVSPTMAGLSLARWANAKSLLRAAMRQTGLAHLPGRYTVPMAPAWTALFARLDHSMTRFGLSRLFRYGSVAGLAPEQIDDAVLTAFLADLQTGALGGKPRQVHRTACLLWNKASAAFPGWPTQVLTVPSYSRSYAVPWASLPATLTADIEAFLAHLAGADLFAETDFRPLRPASIATRRRQLHEFVSALIRHGHPAEPLRTLADVIDPDRAKDGLRYMIAHAKGCVDSPGPDTGRVQAHQVARMLVGVAHHWVKADAATLLRLKAITRNLDPKQHGLRDKNRARLRQFDDEAAVDRLVTLPQRLLAQVRAVKQPGRKDATRVQLAVLVEVLLMLPLRLSNLAGLEIGRTLLRSRHGRWSIAIPGTESKNGAPIEALLPVESGRLLDIYIADYRPLLVVGRSNWLFPGREAGRPKSRDMLRHQIVAGVAAFCCGLVLHPHLFRHIGAKSYLEGHPGAYGVVQLALQHKSMDTTVQNYCGTESAHAVAHFDAHVLKLRARANSKAEVTARTKTKAKPQPGAHCGPPIAKPPVGWGER